jgi:hypothetical protein
MLVGAVKDLQTAIQQTDLKLDELNDKLQEQMATSYPEGLSPRALLQRLERFLIIY